MGEFNCGVSELKSSTKFAGLLSLLCGFQEIDEDEHEAFPNLVTESVTFWNSS